MKRRLGDKKGFTLLELLLAVSLIAFGLLATASMQQVAMRSNTVSVRLSEGIMLAQQVGEDFFSRGMLDPIFSVAVIKANYLFDNVNNSVFIPGVGRFSAQYTITPNAPVNGVPLAGTTQVDIFVFYLPPTGVPPTVQVAAYTTYKRTI